MLEFKSITRLVILSCLLPLIIASNVIQVNDNNFKDEVIKSGRYCLVEFYADWCRHCAKLAPVMEELGELFSDVDSIRIMKINGDKDGKKMVKKYDIPGFPMIRIYHEDDQSIEYEGGRDVESISNFIQQVSGVRLGQINNDDQLPLIPMKSSRVLSLNDVNFEEKVLNSNAPPTIVLFTKSSTNCAKCERGEKVWLQLANTVFSNDAEVVQFGQVNLDDDPADIISSQFGIRVGNSPIVLIFNPQQSVDENGLRRPQVYKTNGDLKTNELIQYINQQFGLHRDDNGELLSSAGRISKLETTLQTLNGWNSEIAINLLLELSELETAVMNPTSKINDYKLSIITHHDDLSMIPYYRKLVNKVINGEQNFFDVELKRLGRILDADTGNLKRSTIDSMLKRINVLQSFIKR